MQFWNLPLTSWSSNKFGQAHFFDNSRSLQLLDRTGFQRYLDADKMLTPSAPAGAKPKTPAYVLHVSG